MRANVFCFVREGPELIRNRTNTETDTDTDTETNIEVNTAVGRGVAVENLCPCWFLTSSCKH